MSDTTPDALVERLHRHAALRVRDAEDEGQWRLDTLAAADRIEALERENERRIEILRLCVERHDAFLAEQTPLIAARMKDAFDVARAFLSRQEAEG